MVNLTKDSEKYNKPAKRTQEIEQGHLNRVDSATPAKGQYHNTDPTPLAGRGHDIVGMFLFTWRYLRNTTIAYAKN